MYQESKTTMLQIKSIKFKSPVVGRRAIVVALSNGHSYKIKRAGELIKTYPAYQDEEREVLDTVYAAGWMFLNGENEGADMDMESLGACCKLAKMFDWDGAGYASEYDDDLEAEQVQEVTYRICHHLDI